MVPFGHASLLPTPLLNGISIDLSISQDTVVCPTLHTDRHRHRHTDTHTHTHTHTLDCTVGTTDRFLSSMSPFMYVESNSGVADPGAAAARPCTTVVEWLCTELPDCSSMLES